MNTVVLAVALLGQYTPNNNVYPELNGRKVVDGHQVDQRQVFQGERPETAKDTEYLGWGKYAPLRGYDARLGDVLADVESHLPAGHSYSDPEWVTWAHEGTHGVNSEIRKLMPEGYNAYYCLNDNVCIFRTPRITKSSVAKYIPVEYRGRKNFKLYINGMESWEHNALYLLDEWVAYLNGARCLREMQKKNLVPPPKVSMQVIDGQQVQVEERRRYEDDLEACCEFAIFACATVIAVADQDPQYPDMEKLIGFVGFNLQRTFNIVDKEHEASKLKIVKYFFAQGVNWKRYSEPHGFLWSAHTGRWTRSNYASRTAVARRQRTNNVTQRDSLDDCCDDSRTVSNSVLDRSQSVEERLSRLERILTMALER